jgi:hypothetical protein
MAIATGWFIAPYKRRDMNGRVARYCAMDDFTSQIIRSDGGDWKESEVLGNVAIVKVKAEETTLALINAAPGFTRIPLNRLDDTLGSLTGAQLTAIRNKVESLGYSASEIIEKLGADWTTHTLREILKFVASRRLKPRYDSVNDEIVCDGIECQCHDIDRIDQEVR